MSSDLFKSDALLLRAEHARQKVKHIRRERHHCARASEVLLQTTGRDEAVGDLAAVGELKGFVADDHAVKHDTQGEDISFAAIEGLAVENFGSHVAGLAADVEGRELGRGGNGASNTKVANLDVELFVQKNVLERHVEVDNAGAVDVFERGDELGKDNAAFLFREALAIAHLLEEVAVGSVLEHHPVNLEVAGEELVVQLKDVRVCVGARERLHELGLEERTLEDVVVLLGVLAQVDIAHHVHERELDGDI